MAKEILLNKIFTGKYPKGVKNVGGEIINFYKSDNGKNYIYITDLGNIDYDAHQGLQSVLFIGPERGHRARVLGKATGFIRYVGGNKEAQIDAGTDIDPIQEEFINNNKVTYGGVSLAKLGSWSSYCLSFEVKSLCFATERIWIELDNNQNPSFNGKVLKLNGLKVLAGQKLKQYISDKANCTAIEELMDSPYLWEDVKPVQVTGTFSSYVSAGREFLRDIPLADKLDTDFIQSINNERNK